MLLSLPGGRMIWLQYLSMPAVSIRGVVAALFLMKVRAMDGFAPQPVRAHVATLREQIMLMSKGRVAKAALWTVASWILEAGVLLVAAHALGVEITPAAAIAITAFTILFQVFHVTPGGIGVYEASMTGALYAQGIPWEQGLALAVLTHGLKCAYSYTVTAAFTLVAIRDPLPINGLGALRGSAEGTSTPHGLRSSPPEPGTCSTRGNRSRPYSPWAFSPC